MDTVYLLHFAQPISSTHSCQHYIGYTTLVLEERLQRHLDGTGAKLCKIAKERGISWEVVRTWEVPSGQGRALEIKLKGRHNSSRLCPICEGQERGKNVKSS